MEYDGSGYAGWQIQPHAPSVQAQVEAALSFVAGAPVRTVCCGRTDAGVHALAQVVHFDAPAPRSPRAWVFGANARLPADISLRWAQDVPADFHARYAARAREYRYLIWDSPARSALYARRAWSYRHRLDADAMHAAAQYLVGEHDFSAYRAAACQAKSPRRDLQRLNVRREGDFVVIDVRANAFLHHMVRNLVGSLVPIGRGLRPANWLSELLDGGDRRAAGATAPAQGLYLLRAEYPPHFDLPNLPATPLLK